jgi:hypothetical protein
MKGINTDYHMKHLWGNVLDLLLRLRREGYLRFWKCHCQRFVTLHWYLAVPQKEMLVANPWLNNGCLPEALQLTQYDHETQDSWDNSFRLDPLTFHSTWGERESGGRTLNFPSTWCTESLKSDSFLSLKVLR